MFQILLANFASQTRLVVNVQAVVLALISLTCLERDTLSAQEALEIEDERPKTGRENSDVLRFPHALPFVTPEEKTKNSLDSLKLDYLSAKRQLAAPQSIFKHFFMWSRKLGEIDMVQHRIAIQPRAWSCTHRSHRAGPIARKRIHKNVSGMPQQTAIEQTQSK